MKKLIAIVLALVMVLGLVACGGSGSEEKTVKVGIAAPDVTHGWVAGVAYYAEKYCKDNNLDYVMTVSSDAAEMTANLQDLVADGCTVIVSWPQWTGMETALQEVIDAGIPVVNFDVDVNCEGIYKVTHNSALTAMADRVIQVRNGTVKEVTINEDPQDIALIEW